MSDKAEAIQSAIRALLARQAAEANYAPQSLDAELALERKRRAEAEKRQAADTDALRDALTWLCPYCGKIHEPLEQPRPFDEGLTLLRVEQCDCERALYEREQARQATAQAAAWRYAAWLEGEALYEAFDTEWPAREKARAQLRLAKTELRAWYQSAEAGGSGLLIAGHFGSGKTHLLRAVWRAFLHQGMRGLFYNEYQIMDRLNDNSDELVWGCKQAKILVLDDLARADFDPYTTWKQQQLRAFYFRVLEGRARQGLSTLFSTNRKAAELKEKVGEAVMDRIYEIISDEARQGLNWISLWDVPSRRRRYVG